MHIAPEKSGYRLQRTRVRWRAVVFLCLAALTGSAVAEQNCRSSYDPSRDSYSNCAAKSINVCGCECRDHLYAGNRAEYDACRAECRAIELCRNCLVRESARQATEESLALASACRASESMLDIYASATAINTIETSRQFDECWLRQRWSPPTDLSGDAFERNRSLGSAVIERNRSFGYALSCLLSTYGENLVEKRELRAQLLDAERQLSTALVKIQKVARYREHFEGVAAEQACPVFDNRPSREPTECAAYRTIKEKYQRMREQAASEQ